MFGVLKTSWALMLGMLFLMIGNGLQGTLLGVRGSLEGFSTLQMSFVMSAYYLGFLGGSRAAPEMIRRVGHVRVFAALASFISAVLILYPVAAHPVFWALGRVVIGFCFSGVYVTAESWLNNSSTNENRGAALSLYMIVQMAGIVTAQGLLALGDPSGYVLFVVSSVLVSISFAPILLSISPTPAFESTKPLPLKRLFMISPLGCVGMFLQGGIFSALVGMSAVYGALAGFSVTQISMFVSAIFVGALILQYPIGWFSDRMDRRMLLFVLTLIGGAAAIFAFMFETNFQLLLAATFIIGGVSGPLYALLIAYTNDFIDYEEMTAASGGLMFISGIGAILGPFVTGYLMEATSAGGFFLFIAVLFGIIAGYAVYRMTQRAGIAVEDTGSYSPVTSTSSPVFVEMAQEVFIEAAQEESEDAI